MARGNRTTPVPLPTLPPEAISRVARAAMAAEDNDGLVRCRLSLVRRACATASAVRPCGPCRCDCRLLRMAECQCVERGEIYSCCVGLLQTLRWLLVL